MYTAPQYGVVNVPSGNVGPSSSMGALGSPQPPMMAVGVGDAAAGPGGAFGRGLPPIDALMATQVGLAYGARALDAGQQYLNQNVNRWINIPQLKYYFAVSNHYVYRKLQRILFPFRTKVRPQSHARAGLGWNGPPLTRSPGTQGGASGRCAQSWERQAYTDNSSGALVYQPARDDVNAPDMYIPLMAFITYMLLIGVALGQRSAFTPEVFGLTSSKAAAVVVFEILAIKAIGYVIDIPGEATFLDLTAYMGYKFVGYMPATAPCTGCREDRARGAGGGAAAVS